MKKIILLTASCMIALNLYAQITTNEPPYGLHEGFKAKFQENLIIPAPDVGQILKEDKDNEQYPGPVPYAYAFYVKYTFENSGEWQTLEDGSKLWRLKVSMPGALSTNTYYERFWLPRGAKFFVYSESTKQSIGAITSEYIEGSKEKPSGFATAIIFGENVVYEYYQPAYVKESPDICISRIDYGYRYINNPYVKGSKKFGDALPCSININCPKGMDWQVEKHAVARVSIPINNRTGFCSCALINNTSNDFTPYVLTADHCLIYTDEETRVRYYDAKPGPNETSNGSGMIFYWEYEHPSCSNSTIEPNTNYLTSTGADVVANSELTDFALLKIKSSQDPRTKTDACTHYLGWDRSGNSVQSGAGIHHPRGDVKKISTTSQIQNYASTIYWFNSPSTSPNTHWRAIYQLVDGSMESGSSGSPLMNNAHKVIGQLHGGSTDSTCTKGNTKYYGKFNVSWTGSLTSTQHPDKERRLNEWLDPKKTNPVTLNGIGKQPTIGTFIDGPSTVNNSQINTFSISSVIPSYNFTWSEPSGYFGIHSNYYSNGANYAQIYFSPPGNRTLQVTATNSCGGCMTVYKNITVLPGGSDTLKSAVYPNPANDIIYIVTEKEESSQLQSPKNDKTFDVRLYDAQGILQRQSNTKSNKIQFNVSNMQNGIYYLHVYDEIRIKPDIHKVIITH